jgi:hypothetical protein
MVRHTCPSDTVGAVTAAAPTTAAPHVAEAVTSQAG